MDFKQYLKESLTSLGEGASDIRDALIEYGQLKGAVDAHYDPRLTKGTAPPKLPSTHNLQKQVQGLMELPMVVGAPLTPRLPGIFRSTKNIEQPAMEAVDIATSGTNNPWNIDMRPRKIPIAPDSQLKHITPKQIEQGPDATTSRLEPYVDTPKLDAQLQRELDLIDFENDPYLRRLAEKRLESIDSTADKYGLNYAYRSDNEKNPYSRDLNERDLDIALSVLAKTTGLPHKAIGLRGNLSLFPDRIDPLFEPGVKGAFQPRRDSISMRPRGDGKHNPVLGHEWFHALDSYLGTYFGKEAGTRLDKDGIPGPLSRSPNRYPARYGSGSYEHELVSELDQMVDIRNRSNAFEVGVHDDDLFKRATKVFVDQSLPNMRPELRDKWSNLMYYIYHPSWTRSLDSTLNPSPQREYLKSPIERGARAFDAWLTHKNSNSNIPVLTTDRSLSEETLFDHLPMKNGGRDDVFIRDMFKAFDDFFDEIRVRGATRSDGKKIVELFGGAAPFGMLAGMPDEQTQKKATPPKDITKGWTSPFDEEDKKFIDRSQDTLKEKRGPSKFWDDYWGTRN